MCGLFGWLSRQRPLTPTDIDWARRALRSLAHRGPDHEGEWTDGTVYLGHRRLSILDLSSAAHQPLFDENRRFALIYNGEIYNYLELRRDLENQGILFRTSSDTEVMLQAILTWGYRTALLRFDGMFAFALYDLEQRTAILARDPLGQKPLYYHSNEDEIVFASELRAILALDRNWRVDGKAFVRFLANSYYAWDMTPIASVHKLLPGCCLHVSRDGIRRERYWDSIPGRETRDLKPEDAVSEFEWLFANSCRQSLRSDVPYGLFLSGGIDSSLILANCIKEKPDVRTFSIAMSEADFDEGAKATAIARHFGVRDHRQFLMGDDSILAALADVSVSSDEPHGDPGFINAYYLAKSCRPHLTVGLAGDGGDELFAGYAPFKGLAPLPWLAGLPGGLMRAIRGLAAAVVPANDSYLGLQFKLLAYLQGFPAKETTRYPLWLAALSVEELRRLASRLPGWFFDRHGKVDSLFDYIAPMMAPAAGGTPQQMLHYFYQKSFLPEFVCMHTDRAAMQVSLEVRSPFLSVPLVEFANRLPDSLKLRNNDTKWILKAAAARAGVPAAVIAAQKQGFTFPIARWLKTVLAAPMAGLLEGQAWVDGPLDPAEIRRLMEEHLAGRRNNYRILYNLMMFARWREHYPGLAWTADF